MKVKAYIHSFQNKETGEHHLGEVEIVRQVGDNMYIAEYRGVRCTAVFKPFAGRYFVDDVYGIISDKNIM